MKESINNIIKIMKNLKSKIVRKKLSLIYLKKLK